MSSESSIGISKIFRTKKGILGLIGVFLFVLIAFVLPCPAALGASAVAAKATGARAMLVLGLLIWAVVWWAAEIFPAWITGTIMMFMLVQFSGYKFADIFAQWSSSSLWLVWGAFILAAAANKTGLLKRIAFSVMKVFPASFGGQTAALLCMGTIISPLIPSANAKTMLGVSLADGIADNMGFEPESKGRYGLFNAAWTGFGLTIPIFITASGIGVILVGLLPKELQGGITFGTWFLAMVPWMVILLVGMWLVFRIFFSPAQKAKLDKEFINQQQAALGKMQSKEIITAILLIAAVLLWIFEKQVGVPAGMTGLIIGVCVFFFGVLDEKQLGSAVPWGLLMWVALIMTLGNVLSAVGISEWLKIVISPVFSPINNVLVIFLMITVLVALSRFIITSQAVALTVFVAILSPVLAGLGYNPFPFFLVIYAASQCWFMPYQHATFAPLPSVMKGVEKVPTVKVVFAYYAVSLIGFLVSIPYWRLIGLM